MKNNYSLTIQEYFSLVKEKILNGDFKILKINSLPKKEISVYLESINYFQYEWADDHNDTRQSIFDYIIIPNDVDWDFTSISFKEFITFLAKNKSTKILNVDIENIEIINDKSDESIKPVIDKDYQDFWEN